MKPTAFISDDWVVGDVCRTPSCRIEPKYGAAYCDDCRDRMEEEDFECRETANIDREVDEMKVRR